MTKKIDYFFISYVERKKGGNYMPSLIDMTGWLMSEHGVPDSRLKVIGLAEPTYTTGGNKVINWLCECLCDKHS